MKFILKDKNKSVTVTERQLEEVICLTIRNDTLINYWKETGKAVVKEIKKLLNNT